jgi:uncharacterized membrane protein YfcA
LPVPLNELLIAAVMIAAAYLVFGISGFGSGLVAIPVLSYLWPVQFVLPIMVVLDCLASSSVVLRERRHADWRELARLTPTTLLGLAAGITLLVALPPKITLLLLGAAVTTFGVMAVRARGPHRQVSAAWVIPTGLVSGIASGLLGVGGAPTVIYLSGRIADKSRLRATLASMLFISVVTRAVLLHAAGLLGTREVFTALLLLPCGIVGLALGARVHLRLSREQFARFVAVLVVVSGISLVLRALA